MKTLLVHLIIIASTLIGGELTFNDGRESRALYSEVAPDALVNDGKRAAYHFTSDITGFLNPGF